MKKAIKRMLCIMIVFVLMLTAVPLRIAAAVPAAQPLPKLTGDMAQDVANIAASQLGYRGNQGTIYGKWWTGVTNWGYDYTYEAWCGMFASWCADQAGAGLGVAYNKDSAMANGMWQFYKDKGQAETKFATTPKTGDFIFFGNSSGRAQHVAVVIDYDKDSGKVIAVGGNQGSDDGGTVTKGSVPWYSGAKWGSKYVLGYGRPQYPKSPAAPTPTPEPGIDGFIDVNENDWYYDSVIYVKENEIMNGLTTNTFGPDQILTRSQFATVLYRISGEHEVAFVQQFADVKENDWYADAVTWASHAGIVNGYGDGYFGSEDSITREQMAVMMHRYAMYLALETVPKMEDISYYSDIDQVSEYAVEALQWAVGYGLINGMTETTLCPLGDTNRGQCAAIIQRFMIAYEMTL